MTAVVPAGAKHSDWKEYKNADGRAYWSHAVTKQSVWEKPDELKTPFEKAMAKTNWKQYTTKDRPYYVNSFTKETVWQLPPDLVELQKKVEEEEAEKERRHVAGEASPVADLRSPSPAPAASPSPEPEYLRQSANPSTALTRYRSPSRSPEPAAPAAVPERVITMPPGGFRNHEDAEEGFMYLLKREGIDETATWDQTMRKIVLDPLYKALDTMAQKKAAFEKYVRQLVEERQAQRDARIAKLRPVLVRLFQQSGAVKPYSTMKTADAVFASERAWRDAQPDERRLVFEDYVRGLRAAEEAAEHELKVRNAEVLSALVRRLDISVSTRWRAAHDMIVNSDAFRDDDRLRQMETVDMLRIYEDYAVSLEREHEDAVRRHRAEQVRRARKAREGFRALLAELAAEGRLTRKSKWKDLYARIKDDDRYAALLGVSGSSPLDLWMDAVDDLQEECEGAVRKIEAALAERAKAINLDTKEDEFEQLVQEAGLAAQIDEKARRDAYDMIHGRLVQAVADEQRRAERKRRHRIDDLRYALRKVRDLDLEGSYDDALPLIKDLPEFKDVAEEDDRRAAFDKFVKRQKDKLREAESSEAGSAHRVRDSGDRRDRERDGDRDKDRDKERDGRDRDRDRERRRSEHRDDHRDRDNVDGDRERERDRRDSYSRSNRHDRSHRDRGDDKERERERDRERRGRDADGEDRDREPKRRRLSRSRDREEGEI
ncbi:U1 snRNP protein [Cryptotrichosporon argae]